jgi:hypothetical protein
MSTEDFKEGSVWGVFGIQARRDARPSIPARRELDNEFRRLKVGASFLNLTTADQHAVQFVSCELD